jgi:hypothetical protein
MLQFRICHQLLKTSRRSLALRHLSVYFGPEAIQPTGAFVEMPLLHSLELRCSGIISGISALTIFSAPNLRSLAIAEVSGDLEEHEECMRCTLPSRSFPRLTSLNISHVPFCLMLSIIACLGCPSMTHLGMTLYDGSPCEEHRAGDDNLCRTTLPITSFAIRAPSYTLNNKGPAKVIRRIRSTIALPLLREVFLSASALSLAQSVHLARQFKNVKSITILYMWLTAYRVLFTSQGKCNLA